MTTIFDIQIDPEFSKRLRRQSADEAAEMRASIDEHGYLNPVISWKEEKLLVDGHHRYDDWQERRDVYEQLHREWQADMASYEKSKPSTLGAMFGRAAGSPPVEPVAPPNPDVIEMSFPNREAVLVFIAKLQYGKRNLTENEMILLRADFMQRMSVIHGATEAAEMASEVYGTSARTAFRDLEFAHALNDLVPVVADHGVDLMEQMLDSDTASSKSDIIKASELLATDPEAAVKLVTTSVRKKRSAAKAKADATPRWERLLSKHKKEMQELLAQIGDDRKLVQQVRRGYRANYEELFSAKPEVKEAA